MNDEASRRSTAEQMLQFVRTIPASAGLEWVKDFNFLYFFETERLQLIIDALQKHGIAREAKLEVLDVGYLHGLVPEFLHRNYPQSRITTIDHPGSPNFSNSEYSSLIASRDYLRLIPLDIQQVGSLTGIFDVIILGEIIEHIDPTVVAQILKQLREKIRPGGLLIVTTPNAIGIYNTFAMFRESERVVCAPIPDPTMGFGHIHLWTPALLAETAAWAGFEQRSVSFYHGREAEKFARDTTNFKYPKHYFLMKAIKWIADRRPSRRGFFVASFQPSATR